jgi:hypothetical protein
MTENPTTSMQSKSEMYYLHLAFRDCIPERYIIRNIRVETYSASTNDETRVIGEFADPGAAYDAAVARGDAPIYRGVVGDFDKKMYTRADAYDDFLEW